jgi:hypothetical protein
MPKICDMGQTAFLNVNGGYMDHLLPTCQVYIKVRINFPASDCLLPLFFYTPSYKRDVMDREIPNQRSTDYMFKWY